MSSWADQTPSDVSAVYLDDTSIRVSFTAPSGIANPYYYYHIVVYDSSGNWYETTGTSTSYTITGLTESTTYSFYIETIQTAATGYYTTRTAQFPVIYSFSTSDVSYNAVKLNWTGQDFSFVRLVRSSGAASSGVDLSYTTAAVSYYDNSTDISGNTVYYYYITPYLYLNDTLNTGAVVGASSITTKVAPPTNVSATTLDGSAITIAYTSGKNSYSNSVYYTARSVNIDTADVSGSETSLIVDGLSGNTSYSFYVIVTLDNSSALVATSDVATATTATQAPTGAVSFYDNSAILVEISSKNTYSSILYSASVADEVGASIGSTSSSSPVLVQNLSGNTVYYITVSNTLNGNSSLNASSTLENTVTTNVQSPTNVTLYNVDSSSIAVEFSAGANSYSSLIWKGIACDTSGQILTTVLSTVENASPLYITELSGNTTYIAKVSVTLNGNTSLSATSNTTVSATTAVRPPYNLTLSFYDSSSIAVSFVAAPNTYTSVSYKGYAYDTSGNTTTAQNSASPVQVRGLSADTTYTFYITNTLNGNSALTAQSDSITAITSGYPVNKVIYLTGVTYSTITVNWAGVDISYVMVYRNSTSLGTDYLTPYDDTDISGNTYYSYYVVPYYIDRGVTITGEPSATVSTTTPVAPVTDLSATFYDSSAIILSFSIGRNSYSSSIYYIAQDANISIDASSVLSPISIADLSGNTTYNIYIKTIVDNSYNASSETLSVTTDIQSPKNPYISFYDNSAITVAFDEPTNSDLSYYSATATDLSGVSVIATNTNTPINIDGLLGNTTYYVSVATVVSGNVSSSSIYVGSVQTGIIKPYSITTTEISTTDSTLATIIDVSFIAPSQSGTVYYIASVSDTITTIDASSTTSPIQITGLSGNTSYTVYLTTVIDGTSYVSSAPSITTSIQIPVDVEIINMEDASFTIGFTTGRNAMSSSQYYILRATDVSSSEVVDVSSDNGILSMYDTYLNTDTYYEIDIITVVDNSFVSYGGIFRVATAQLPYDIYASELSTDDPAIASYVAVYFTAPEQYQTVYYVATATSGNNTTEVTSTTSPIQLTGLSGNTTYSITFTTVLNGKEYVSTTAPSVTTAIQTPVDLEIVNLEDASFTVEFTTGRNAVTETQYYILRATDVSDGSVIDVSGADGILSMYDLVAGEYYNIDLLTVVDGSMISYGGIFDIGAPLF